jgi:hypothetical protein
MPDLLKFQMLLIYTTKGSSVHGHVIVACVQKKYSCSIELADPLGKLVFLGSRRNYTQLWAAEESWSS